MTDKENIQIRIDLDGELKQKFLAIKKLKGIENNTDLIRLMITEYYASLNKD